MIQIMTPMKVFKIPDGEGGIRYRVQTPDGQWHDTDENGTPLKKNIERISRNPKKRKDSSSCQTISFSFRNPEDFDLLESYCLFRTQNERRRYSRSEIIVELLTGAIRKDKEFSQYNKSLNQ